ncbi:MAG: phosphatidate cytidylyltransferase [Clostridiales bacterium]|nr:phosphatidate cytidylyltransferase [Clostridiales bacterium]
MKRIITGTIIAIVYVAVFALSMYVHQIFFDIYLLFLAAAGTYEICRALPGFIGKPIYAINIVAVALGFGSFWLAQYLFPMSYASGLGGYFVSLALMVLFTVIFTAASKNHVSSNGFATVFAMLYPTMLLMFTMALNYFLRVGEGLSSSLPYRNAGVALTFSIPALTDVFAYLVGSKLRGKKLCPNISPNKTISGAVGGLFGGVVGGGLIAAFIALGHYLDWNVFGLSIFPGGWVETGVSLALLGLLGSVSGQAGDIFASYIKRRAGIKDYSNLLPGHGGILDRIDSSIFTGVVVYLYFAVAVIFL